MKPRVRAAFTLLELLVALCFLGLVGATVFATFSGGFRIWERVEILGDHDRQVQIVLDELRRDLSNARAFEPIRFVGQYDEVSFPSIQTFQFSRGRFLEQREEVGRVGYFFDSYRRILCRSKHSYRVIRRTHLRDSSQTLLEDVDRVRFSYETVDPKGGTSEWVSRWESPGIPLAVKMEIDYKDGTNAHQKNRTLLVVLPTAQIQRR